MFFEQYKQKLMYAGAVLVMILVAFLAGRGTAPNQVETKTEIKIVEKIVEVEKKQAKSHKNVKTKIVKAPDGTVTTVIEENTDTTETSETSKKTEKDTEKTVSTSTGQDKQYRLGLFADTYASVKAFEEKPSYGVSASRRLFGPAWLDAQYNIKRNAFAVGLSIEF